MRLQATRKLTGFASPVTHLQGSTQILHFMKMLGLDCDSGLLWVKARAVTNLISARELTLTDFQQQWGWRHFEGYLHKKRTGNLHWKKTKSVISNFFLDTTDGWVITMHCAALLSWCRTVSSTEGKRLWEFTLSRGLWLNYCVHASSLQALHSLQLFSSCLCQKHRISCQPTYEALLVTELVFEASWKLAF